MKVLVTGATGFTGSVLAGKLVKGGHQVKVFIRNKSKMTMPHASEMEVIEGDITAQARQVIGNLQAVLAAAGAGLEDVVKTTVFLQDMAHFAALNEEYGRHFVDNPPARSTVEVAKLPLGALVEIEVIALIP